MDTLNILRTPTALNRMLRLHCNDSAQKELKNSPPPLTYFLPIKINRHVKILHIFTFSGRDH